MEIERKRGKSHHRSAALTDLKYWNCKIKHAPRKFVCIGIIPSSQCNWNNVGINWKVNFYSSTGQGKLRDYRPIFVHERNYCQKLMRACQRCDTVALLIFIKRSAPGASFRIIPTPAHNENKISCLNFTRIIITKRRAVAPRKNTGCGLWRTSARKCHRKKKNTRYFCASYASFYLFFPLSFFFCKMKNLKVRLCYHKDKPNTNVDFANANAGVAWISRYVFL